VLASKRVRAELPRLLWLGHLGIVLFWVSDTSPAQLRTRDLVDKSAPIVDRLVRLTALPGGARVADDLARLIHSIAR
jgi:Tetracyclin repressor-like, C-terminal domain